MSLFLSVVVRRSAEFHLCPSKKKYIFKKAVLCRDRSQTPALTGCLMRQADCGVLWGTLLLDSPSAGSLVLILLSSAVEDNL